MCFLPAFLVVTGEGQRVKLVSPSGERRSHRAIGKSCPAGSPPSSWPLSLAVKVTHLQPVWLVLLWGKSRGGHETLQADMRNEFQTPVSHRNDYYPVTCQWGSESGCFSSFQLCFVRQPWLLLVAEGLQSYLYVSHTLKIPCESVFLRRLKTSIFFFLLQSDVTGILWDWKRP